MSPEQAELLAAVEEGRAFTDEETAKWCEPGRPTHLSRRATRLLLSGWWEQDRLREQMIQRARGEP